MVLPVLPEVPLPIEPLLPVELLLFFTSLPLEPLLDAPLRVEPLPVELLPRLPLLVEPLPRLPPVELLTVLLPGMFLFVSTMMVSFKKS